MYIIELLLKKFRTKKEKRQNFSFEADENVNYEKCEHVFMPIDSTGKTFACTKCGEILKK